MRCTLIILALGLNPAHLLDDPPVSNGDTECSRCSGGSGSTCGRGGQMRRWTTGKRQTDNGTARVRVESYDCTSCRLRGTFEMEAMRARTPKDTMSFTDGSFDVRLRHEPFEYCIEG